MSANFILEKVLKYIHISGGSRLLLILCFSAYILYFNYIILYIMFPYLQQQQIFYDNNLLKFPHFYKSGLVY